MFHKDCLERNGNPVSSDDIPMVHIPTDHPLPKAKPNENEFQTTKGHGASQTIDQNNSKSEVMDDNFMSVEREVIFNEFHQSSMLPKFYNKEHKNPQMGKSI